MGASKRLALALVVILSGFLLVPFVALPKESFRWQLFAGAYGSGPALGTNHSTGGPGSYFLISGFGFKPGATLALKANGVLIGTVDADASGAFRITLSTAGAGVGGYVITAEEDKDADLAQAGPFVGFRVLADAPVRARVDGVGQLALPNVPTAILPQLWLPLVTR